MKVANLRLSFQHFFPQILENFTFRMVVVEWELLKFLGLKPFEEVPRTEDNTEIDYYKVLDLDPDVLECLNYI